MTNNNHTTLKGHTGDINSVAFSDTYLVSGAGDKTVRLWNIEDYSEHPNSPLLAHSYSVYCCAFSPNGKILATSSMDGKLILWDSKSATQIAVLEHRTQSSIRVFRFSPDGTRMVSGSDDNNVVLWDLKTKQPLRTFEGHEASVVAVAFSPNTGLYVVSGSNNGDLRVWDAKYGHSKQLHFLLDGHDLGVTCCEFSPTYGSAGDIDASNAVQVHYLLATAGNDDVVKLWDVLAYCGSSNMEIKLRDQLQGHSGPLMCCCFSPDGKLIASVGSDKTIRLWNPVKATQVHILEGHTRYITTCAFSRDGLLIATGSNDRTVKIWSIVPGKDATPMVPTAPDLVDLSLPSPKRQPVSQWSIDDVCRWLDEIGLSQYIAHFRCNAIDGQELLTLSQAGLQQHIAPLGHRNKILRALENVEKHPMIQPYENDDHLPDEYLCPITREVMKEPVIAADGYTYEKSAIDSWIQAGKANSPMTNAPLSHHELMPNRCLKMLIQKRRVSAP